LAFIVPDTAASAESTVDVPMRPPAAMPAAMGVGAPIRGRLARLAFQGSVWVIFCYGVCQLARLGSNIILTRLLESDAFGIIALVSAVMQGLIQFSDVGVGPAVIRHGRGEEAEFYNTAWTIQVIRGFAVLIVGCVAAYPVARFYGQPQLLQVIPVAMLSALITSFNSTKLYTENRQMRLSRVMLIEMASLFISIIGMTLLAYQWRSVWALVFGWLLGDLSKMLLSQFVLPGPRNSFCWDRQSRRELLHFGRWIFLSTMFTFLALQADKLMLGRLMPIGVLGVYSVALGIIAAATGVFEMLCSRVLMPAMAHISRASEKQVGAALVRAREFVLGVAGIAVANVIWLSPTLFQVLYRPQYRAAGWIAQLLAMGIWFVLLQRSSQAGLVAIGRSKGLALSNATNFAVTLVAAPVGFYIAELNGFIAGWILGNVAAVVVIDRELLRSGISVVRQDVRLTLRLAVLVAAGLLLQQFLHDHVPAMNQFRMSSIVPATLLSLFALSIVGLRTRVEHTRLRSLAAAAESSMGTPDDDLIHTV